ncbi:hypothetical protein CTEN210_04893 [Chaetoceros tenuissimus]|uniref:Lon N-terminal domain-containing protein n=1 Tax=Chaetoceros tenuissimus TaxID=426638 RepID=A0AAD3CLT5_9STRA|nr:hypothetical protein CTEN210_04893 [Chaetoceros tenuissimus]
MKFRTSAVASVLGSIILATFVGNVFSFSIHTPSNTHMAFVNTIGVSSSRNEISQSSSKLRMADEAMDMDIDDDEEEEDDQDDPLADGVDSIFWLPSISSSKSDTISGVRDGAEVLPFFPLGGIVYTPNSEHVLNIFEPRYRQMYTDILMNGSKRFVVAMSHPEKPGTFAEIGVIFYLDDLKEVSEETGDQIKYICNHRVTRRVKIHKILNPEAWESRETYLKVEGTILDDDEEDDDTPDVQMDESIENSDIYQQLVGSISSSKPFSSTEESLKKSFEQLVNVQHDLEEDVRFTRASVSSLAVRSGSGENGLWQTIRLWQSFIEQRLVARQNEMQMEFQEKLLDFLKKEKGLDENELPSAIGFNDLSPALQDEVQELQKRMAVELQPLVLENTLAIQKILEMENHEARCNLLTYFIDAEKKRLDAKKQLQSMFGMVTEVEFDDDTSDDDEDDDDETDDTDGNDEDPKGSSGSLLVDEPDAFQ